MFVSCLIWHIVDAPFQLFWFACTGINTFGNGQFNLRANVLVNFTVLIMICGVIKLWLTGFIDLTRTNQLMNLLKRISNLLMHQSYLGLGLGWINVNCPGSEDSMRNLSSA
jgi:hypothetical protein